MEDKIYCQVLGIPNPKPIMATQPENSQIGNTKPASYVRNGNN